VAPQAISAHLAVVVPFWLVIRVSPLEIVQMEIMKILPQTHVVLVIQAVKIAMDLTRTIALLVVEQTI
jgi:hypothetical protein